MRLLSLTLEQYRSHAKEEIRFAPCDVHLFVGPNGAGKTNILEAVVLLSLAKSFHGAEEEHLIRWETEFYRVRAEAAEECGERRTFELVSQRSPRRQKACFVNDVRVPLLHFVGRLPTVTFLPQDLQLFTGPPAERRRFLDQLLCQVSPEYLQALTEYQRILKQRNILLKRVAEGSSPAELEVWDAGLSERGARITLQRLELIEMLQCTLGEELRTLGAPWREVRLVYERRGSAQALPELQEELRMLLASSRERDLLLQSTTVGPHRDDWSLEADGRSVASFASRGEQRVALLALLFLQVSYLELRRGEKPVVLLDDVFSELDDARQTALLASLEGHQVLITATHAPAEPSGAGVYEVGAQGVRPLPVSGALRRPQERAHQRRHPVVESPRG